MNLNRIFSQCVMALALMVGARAMAVVPAGSSAGTLPNITVWDEANSQSQLWSKLQAGGSGPVFVLPVYTRCTMSCPVLASKLARETARLAGATAYRVLIFSFDPADDAASLREFRVKEKLPDNWMLVRASAGDIRKFCDFFHYTILNEGPVMIHTNQIFLLDHTLRWRATFIDESWNVTDLALWMKRAESGGLLSWIPMNPEQLAFIALGGMVVSLLLILWVLISRSRRMSHPDVLGTSSLGN